MAKSEYVSITMTGYVAGMESDPEFVGCAFRRKVDSEETPVRNKARTGLGQDKSRIFGVRTLGAVAASGLKGINKAFVLALIDAAKKQNMALETAVERYNGRYPEHGLTVEKVKEIQKATTQAAKDLLA